MIEEYFTQAVVLTRLQDGPLGPHLPAFLSKLEDAGYSRCSIRRRLRTADRFLRWLQQQETPIATATPRHVEAFIGQHERVLARERPSGRRPSVIAGLNRIVALLQQQGILIAPPPQAPQERWLEHFDEHLAQACGLAARTRRNYLRYARRLMRVCFFRAESSRMEPADRAATLRIRAQRGRQITAGQWRPTGHGRSGFNALPRAAGARSS